MLSFSWGLGGEELFAAAEPLHAENMGLMVETDFFAEGRAVKSPLIVEMVSIAERVFHTPLERLSQKRAPSALALNHVISQRPWGMRAHHHQVGLITATDESSVLYTEEACRVMTHQFHQPFKRDIALVDKTEHRHQ